MALDLASVESNSAQPSPCAVAIAMRLPAMPEKKSEGPGVTSTMTKRASNCSERLVTKRGQCSAPGISPLSLLIIWQPLQVPSAKVSPRAKKALNSSFARGLNRIAFAQPAPAPSTSPQENPPPAG